MARTFNRRPFSVDTPSSKEANNHFFNHANWKGMAVDKNFLVTDQETFEDCNNVYMDSEGLLRSRPSVKYKWPADKKVYKFWVFDNLLVYVVAQTAELYRIVVETSDGNQIFIDDIPSLNIRPVLKDDKIFIFCESDSDGNNRSTFVNIKTNESGFLEDYIYSPNIEVITGAERAENESENLLTNSKLVTYMYTSDVVMPPDLIGQSIEFDIDGKSYELSYDPSTTSLLVYERSLILPSYANYLITGEINGQTVYVACELVLYNRVRRIWCSADGRHWDLRNDDYYTLVDFQIGLSKDSSILYIVTSVGSYIISVVKNESGSYKYNKFTKIHDFTNYSKGFAYFVTDDLSFAYYHTNTSTTLWIKSPTLSVTQTLAPDILTHIQTADVYYSEGKFTAYAICEDNDGSFAYREIVTNSTSPFSYQVNKISTLTGDFVDNSVSMFKLHAGITIRLKIWNHGTDDSYMAYDIYDCIENKMLLQITHRELSYRGVGPGALTPRISDDGNYVFVPRGVVFVNLIENNKVKTMNYLNRDPDSQLAVIHNTKNNSSYSLPDNPSVVYSNDIKTPIALKVYIDKDILNKDFLDLLAKDAHVWSELDEMYVAIDNGLYITETRKNDDGEFLWYFPKINKQTFVSKLTGFQPISSSEMGIFCSDEIWYCSINEGLRYYYKSKIDLGLQEGSEIVTSYDGTQVIFPSKRGLVSLSYQNFIASTDQALTYLSDAIYESIKDYLKTPTRLLKYQYWIILYDDTDKLFVLDVRNGSWWPMTYRPFIGTLDRLYVMDNHIVLTIKDYQERLNLMHLDKSDNDYFDLDRRSVNIDWHLTSQKLHFNAVNYVKHINNITLYAVLDSDKLVNFRMDVKNYRKRISKSEVQTISYRVDVIRTVVKKVNYFKVDEFQYTIKQDDEQAVRVPLSLSGVTIKYSIGGLVR